ncbi:hypothetical protein AV530_006148 [Patagioenas fasciata monilis]|uniref:Uncharacterized protein n=1 Tax=Patagioenas fasciata monilis TaxID=372326 RepID=A0A1V4J8C4_PATFA|nr:hypothetical protein AV530_006148 [Patagioenas fasciata monilis]
MGHGWRMETAQRMNWEYIWKEVLLGRSSASLVQMDILLLNCALLQLRQITLEGESWSLEGCLPLQQEGECVSFSYSLKTRKQVKSAWTWADIEMPFKDYPAPAMSQPHNLEETPDYASKTEPTQAFGH